MQVNPVSFYIIPDTAPYNTLYRVMMVAFPYAIGSNNHAEKCPDCNLKKLSAFEGEDPVFYTLLVSGVCDEVYIYTRMSPELFLFYFSLFLFFVLFYTSATF